MTYRNETEFTNALLTELKKIPRTKWWRNQTGRRAGVRFGDVGSPDILGIVAGRFVGIECKTETGELSEDQAEWHATARNAGAIVIVARPSNAYDVLSDVDEVLQTSLRGKQSGLNRS